MVTIQISSPGLPMGHGLTIRQDELFELIKQAGLGEQLSLFLAMKGHLMKQDNKTLKVLLKNSE
jgi:hypothetical protein